MSSNKVIVKIKLDVEEKTLEDHLKILGSIVGSAVVFFCLMPFIMTYAVATGKTKPKTDFSEAWWWLLILYAAWLFNLGVFIYILSDFPCNLAPSAC